MQIACKYRSLSRYRNKRSISLYIPRSRYVFFSRFRCRFYTPSVSLSLSFSRFSDRRAQKRRNQSRDKVSTNEIVTEFFLIPRAFVFNPSSKSSAAESSTYIQFFDLPRRIYETSYIADVRYVGKKRKRQ